MNLNLSTHLLFALAFAAAMMAGCATQTSQVSTPMPPDVVVVDPDARLPADVRVLSGKWTGKWRGLAGGQQQENSLIIERIEGNTATVIYSQGDHPRFPAFFQRTTAQVSPGKIEFTLALRNPASFKYELQSDGSLSASMSSRGFTAISTLNRAVPR